MPVLKDVYVYLQVYLVKPFYGELKYVDVLGCLGILNLQLRDTPVQHLTGAFPMNMWQKLQARFGRLVIPANAYHKKIKIHFPKKLYRYEIEGDFTVGTLRFIYKANDQVVLEIDLKNADMLAMLGCVTADWGWDGFFNLKYEALVYYQPKIGEVHSDYGHLSFDKVRAGSNNEAIYIRTSEKLRISVMRRNDFSGKPPKGGLPFEVIEGGLSDKKSAA